MTEGQEQQLPSVAPAKCRHTPGVEAQALHPTFLPWEPKEVSALKPNQLLSQICFGRNQETCSFGSTYEVLTYGRGRWSPGNPITSMLGAEGRSRWKLRPGRRSYAVLKARVFSLSVNG